MALLFGQPLEKLGDFFSAKGHTEVEGDDKGSEKEKR